jgi:formate hydrogenlyase subunit 6/NADH:ubiquinone oxidoreductase subunit I
MLFRILDKDGLRGLVEMLLESTEVIGPRQVVSADGGRPVHHFLPVTEFDQLDLGYESTEYSAKTYFLPFEENLSTFSFTDDDWQQEIRYRVQPRAMIGLHPCDINGLLKLDKVLARDFFPSPYYLARRRNTLVVGIDHEPCERGFCRSVDADTVQRGFDLHLTDLGDRYFVAIGSDRGYSLLQQVPAREIGDDDTRDYLAERRRIDAVAQDRVPVHNLPNLLDIEFDSEVWRHWGGKCLSCGSCAMVCPTCYCYGVGERVTMDWSSGAKVKRLYSCNLVDFAEVAGGHNFRPDRHTRLKYRYYHQHRGFVEEHDEPKCVGCNRCGRTCLAGISPVQVIHDLQDEEDA